MIDFALYKGREQTGVKHFILAEYLQRFGPIIGSWCSTITYVDCFSGPWQQQSEGYEDTSFFIALQELRNARDAQRTRSGRTLKLRAFFIEKNPESYVRLRDFAHQVPREDVEIETRNDALENCIADIVSFVQAGHPKNFPFMFIDRHIRRLVEHPEESLQESFESLYGPARCARVLELVRGKVGLEREDILVSEYMQAIRETGQYEHASAAVVLNPAMDRTHFHLIYGTRSPKGLEVFKGAEKKAMEAMQQARSDVQDRKDDEKTRQGSFDFRRQVPKYDSHYQELRVRYMEIARGRVLAAIKQSRRISYDTVYSLALGVPLTFDSDLKQWIKEWRESAALEIEGATS